MEGVPFPASPSQALHNVKDRGIWSLPPSSPAVPRQEIGLQVPTQGPRMMRSLPVWTIWGLDTKWGVETGRCGDAPQICLRLLIRD